MNAEAWPVLECSVCRKACAIRVVFLLASGGEGYVWTRDCKCKRGQMQVVAGREARGPVTETEGL